MNLKGKALTGRIEENTEDLDYFLYTHHRADNNEMFYAGISHIKRNKKGLRERHSRAFSRSGRNYLWREVVKETDFIVNIERFSDTEPNIKRIEVDVVRSMGRDNLNEGYLTNLTDGGDGRVNPSVESMKGQGDNLKPYQEALRKKVYQYSLNGEYIKEWDSVKEAGKFCCPDSVNPGSGITIAAKGKAKQCKGFLWSYEKKDKIPPITKNKTNAKKIVRYTLDNKDMKVYSSAREAAKDGFSYKAISICLRRNGKTSGGYKWKYL